jgi:hypothetical protein
MDILRRFFDLKDFGNRDSESIIPWVENFASSSWQWFANNVGRNQPKGQEERWRIRNPLVTSGKTRNNSLLPGLPEEPGRRMDGVLSSKGSGSSYGLVDQD